MKKLDKLGPSIRQLAPDGLDPSLMKLAIIAVLPFLACVLIVFHDPAVSTKILLSLFIVFVVSGVIAGGLCYVFMSREKRPEEH